MWRGQVKHDQIRKAMQTATHSNGACEVIHEEDQEYEDRSCSEQFRADAQKLFLESEKDLMLDPGTETDVRESIYSSLELNSRAEQSGSLQQKRTKPPLISIDFDQMEAGQIPAPEIQTKHKNPHQTTAKDPKKRIMTTQSPSELRRISPGKKILKKIKTCVSPKMGSKTESFLLQEKSVRTSDIEGKFGGCRTNNRRRPQFEFF